MASSTHREDVEGLSESVGTAEATRIEADFTGTDCQLAYVQWPDGTDEAIVLWKRVADDRYYGVTREVVRTAS